MHGLMQPWCWTDFVHPVVLVLRHSMDELRVPACHRRATRMSDTIGLIQPLRASVPIGHGVPTTGRPCTLKRKKGRGTAQMRQKGETTEMAMRYGGNGVDAADDGFVWADADVEGMLNGADAAEDGCEGAGAAGGKCI